MEGLRSCNMGDSPDQSELAGQIPKPPDTKINVEERNAAIRREIFERVKGWNNALSEKLAFEVPVTSESEPPALILRHTVDQIQPGAPSKPVAFGVHPNLGAIIITGSFSKEVIKPHINSTPPGENISLFNNLPLERAIESHLEGSDGRRHSVEEALQPVDDHNSRRDWISAFNVAKSEALKPRTDIGQENKTQSELLNLIQPPSQEPSK